MLDEGNYLGLYFSGISGVWGVFLTLWLIGLIRKPNLLNITMTLVLFFRLSNSVSLSCYFITENLSCGLVAVSTYPLFNTFVLTVLMMISKGYCILYKENNDRGVIAIATTLGTSYLFYSVSQIYSAFLNFLIFFYLFLFFYYSNSNTEEVLALLHEKSQIISLRSRDLRLIGIRIKRYKLFKKVIWVYLIFQSFVISIAFVFEVFDLGYTFFGWYLIEIVIESIRFFTVSSCFFDFFWVEFFIIVYLNII